MVTIVRTPDYYLIQNGHAVLAQAQNAEQATAILSGIAVGAAAGLAACRAALDALTAEATRCGGTFSPPQQAALMGLLAAMGELI